MLWLQRQDHSHPDTARIDRRTPDRLLIKERLAHYLKQANLRRDLGRIAVGAFTGRPAPSDSAPRSPLA